MTYISKIKTILFLCIITLFSSFEANSSLLSDGNKDEFVSSTSILNKKTNENDSNKGFYVVYHDDKNLVFLDDPLLSAKDKDGVENFFYHEIRATNPYTLLLILSQADCEHKKIKSKSFWEMDFKKEEMIREVEFLPSAKWSDVKENTVDENVFNGICHPENKNELKVIKNTNIIDIIEKYINKKDKILE